MPGTLMVEAAVQALSFLAAALGLTVERDSHGFEPEAGRPAQFICRGQVIPNTDHEVIYEVFVDEIVGGATPVIRAALLASCDGLKVFYCPVFSLRLRPHWPQLAGPQAVARIVGPSGDVRGDERALMEMASGAPSRALGSLYAGFDGGGRLPRLPSPPYHMVSRIVDVDAPPGLQAAGLSAKAQYDVPPTAWYFDDAPGGVMPLSVLSEVALQPCGWLAGYAGLALSGDSFFRNLDGKGVVHAEVGRDAGRLDVTTTLKQVSRAGPLTLVFYDVEVTEAAGRAVMSLATSFGFFTAAALASQAGLKTDGALREAVAVGGAGVDATDPDGGGAALPSGRLRMIDRVERVDAEGGPAGLGRIVCAQDVDPRAWYFRAHFFADPVQPGSLGLEALVEALTRLIKAKGLDAGFARPVVQALAMREAVGWTYRGQVTPGAGKVTTLVDLLAVEREGDGALLLRARGHLFVDGLRIYQMEPLAVRVREGATEPVWTGRVAARDTPWLDSHRPTHTLPALPLMAMAGMALRAGGKVGTGVTLTDFAPTAWAVVPEGGMALLARVDGDGAVSLTGRAGVPDDVAGTRLAAGRIVRGEVPALTLKGMRTTGMAPLGDLYGSAQLFHGPALHMVTGGKRGPKGFALEVDLARASVPGDPFDPAILDALVHGVPHQSAEDWFDVPDGMVIYPVRVVALSLLGGLPRSGVLQVRGRPLPGARPPHHLPIRIEAWSAQGPYAVLDLIEKAYPKGRFGELDLRARRAFIRGEQAEPFAVLSRVDAATGDTLLVPMDVTACDWLPGSVAQTYGTGALSGTALVRAVALKEHFARLWRVHPREVVVDEVFASAPGRGRGRVRYTLAFDREERAWRVRLM
jgi:3-hydroxymyristoyl/3-hydroxydecanoyl-(acyl carrier protein) dehydratase